MKNYIIIFNQPMDKSKAIYTYDDTTIPNKHLPLILFNHNDDEYQEEPSINIGTCLLNKDNIGVFIENTTTNYNINITNHKLRPASFARHRYMDDETCKTNHVKAELSYIYIHIEEAPLQWIRNNKLNNLLNEI